MPSALGHGEEHDVVPRCLGDGRVLWLVVGKVVHSLARLDDGLADTAIGVVR